MDRTPGSGTADGNSDNGGAFDPRQAAALLDQTTQQTRRKIEPFPPWLLAVRGVLVLATLGAVWLSVRGQHPYRHPTYAVIPAVVAFGILNAIATLAVAKRATVGVSGKSRLRPAQIALVAAIWVAVFVVMGVLASAGVSDRIVYGLYPASVPLMAGGLAWAGLTAARADWREFGGAIAIAVTGAVALLAGPAGAWLVAGVGLCLTLLGLATVVAWRQRRSVVRP